MVKCARGCSPRASVERGSKKRRGFEERLTRGERLFSGERGTHVFQVLLLVFSVAHLVG